MLDDEPSDLEIGEHLEGVHGGRCGFARLLDEVPDFVEEFGWAQEFVGAVGHTPENSCSGE